MWVCVFRQNRSLTNTCTDTGSPGNPRVTDTGYLFSRLNFCFSLRLLVFPFSPPKLLITADKRRKTLQDPIRATRVSLCVYVAEGKIETTPGRCVYVAKMVGSSLATDENILRFVPVFASPVQTVI